MTVMVLLYRQAVANDSNNGHSYIIVCTYVIRMYVSRLMHCMSTFSVL